MPEKARIVGQLFPIPTLKRRFGGFLLDVLFVSFLLTAMGNTDSYLGF